MRSLVYSGCRLHSSKFHPIWCSGSSGTRTSPSLLRSAHRVPPSGSRRRSDRCRPSQAEPSRQHILLEVLLKTLQESQAMAQQVRRSATVFFTSGRRRHCRFRLLRSWSRLSRRRSPRRFLPPPSRYTSRRRQPSFASLVLHLDDCLNGEEVN
ncbi:Os07g0405133 [Oryza sativa Japonica Group]|uniref:Os07g0405133 protein n=1 Tax=Oryza sativa subsp. japonica TaxID=39947 RepID=C7J4I5_ORYSJ|nr:Os07g0405133 [Oryza sativa Japonica Group]|eukprot:NP_001175154.1 Os07g0405133 [Oryza sativa Japonica Group]